MSTPTSPSTSVAVWDLPTRLFHWILVLCVALLYVSGAIGGLGFSLPLPTGQWVMGNMDVHMALGEIVMGLVIFRLIWGLMGSSTARFGTFVQGPKAVIGYLCALRRGELPLTVGHNPAGALMIIALLVLLAAQVGTGLFANDDIFSEGPLAKLVSSSTSSTLTGIHGFIFNLLLLAVAAHVGAALYYRLRGKNLIQSMVTGRKPAALMPTGASAPKLASPLLAVPVIAIAALAVWAVITLP
jgi:cytochrome b